MATFENSLTSVFPAEYDVRSLLDALSEGVLTTDLDGHITGCNQAAQRILNYPVRQVVGQSLKTLFPREKSSFLSAVLKAAHADESILCQRCNIYSSQGVVIPVDVSVRPLIDKARATVGVVMVFRDLRKEEILRKAVARSGDSASFIGEAQCIEDIRESLPVIAKSSVTVLISGESGTGKEVIARLLHQQSERADKPFIAINCGALPDALLESELFGYEAGAFTDARKAKPGRFALADGGTLFLDEIGEISAAMQVRLLRVLQERQYEPLGGTHSVSCDIRIIAASNKNLSEEVRAGRFRRDLYYRLAVIPLRLPPLRERGSDVLLLAQYFIERLAIAEKRPIPEVGSAFTQRLLAWHWPGNVRELANAIERSWVLGHGSLAAEHLPGSGLTGVYCKAQPVPGSGSDLAKAEAQALLKVLREHDWNRLATARSLGIHKTTLYRKIRTLGLKPPRQGESNATR